MVELRRGAAAELVADVSVTPARTSSSAARTRWTGRGGRFQLITDPVEITAATVGDYMSNRIVTVTGPRGEPTRALYQEISRNASGTDPMGTSVAQNVLQISPASQDGDFYVSYWIKLQPDLAAALSRSGAVPARAADQSVVQTHTTSQ